MSAPAGQSGAAGLVEVAPPTDLARCFAKTEAGRLEIRQRAVPLSRSARNLLLIIDATRSVAEWIAMVQGCDRAALQSLQDAALVADAGAPAAASTPGVLPAIAAPALAGAVAAVSRVTLDEALEQRSYSALYDRITAEARPRLGLMKAYKMIMDLERCSGPPEIRALARRFVDQVRELHGDAAAKALVQVLITPE